MPVHDLTVIGAGPGGYVAAIRAAQLGLNTACVEKEAVLGGTCLRIGCIPSKALLESSEQFHVAKHLLDRHGVKIGDVQLDLPQMLKRKDEVVDGLTRGVDALFKKNKVQRYTGAARFSGPGTLLVEGNGEPVEIRSKYIIIATGSLPAPLKGVEFDSDRIGASTEALAYPEVPERLVVIGAGYIGLELGSVWNRLGSKVTVLEYLDRILPGMDADLAREGEKAFRKQGIEFRLGAKVTGAKVNQSAVRQGAGKPGQGGSRKASRNDNGAPTCTVTIEGADPIECDRVLVAVGRIPNTQGLGLEAGGVALDERGRIRVDEHFRTSAEHVFAIGDVIAGPMLAHKAEEEGVACVEHIVTGYGHVDYDSIPGIVYTEPEIASVGKTEQQLQDAGVPYRKGVFHYRGNGRARALDRIDGFCKMLAHKQTDRLLGVHIIGARAGDMIAEAAVSIAFGASAEDVARASHAHPTLAEMMKEAALAVDGRAIHA